MISIYSIAIAALAQWLAFYGVGTRLGDIVLIVAILDRWHISSVL